MTWVPPRPIFLVFRALLFLVSTIVLVGGGLLGSHARGMGGFGGGPTPRSGFSDVLAFGVLTFCCLSCFSFVRGRAFVVGSYVAGTLLVFAGVWLLIWGHGGRVFGVLVLGYAALWLLMCHWRMADLARLEAD